MPNITYKDAGVDLQQYEDSMSRVAGLVRRTFSPRVISSDGGFAGLFQLDFPGRLFARDYVDPTLVACSDGVGTKMKVAMMANRHETVGIDLVAMSVNDAICVGAEPLFFLDYLAMSADDPPLTEAIVCGITEGCLESDCALLGGETAIMPDLYAPGEYDLAGFCVGVVEKRRLIDGKAISPDDVLIGVASDGLHSNGFSLVRKIVFELAQLGVDDHVEALGTTVGEELLRPTRIYARSVRKVQTNYAVKQVLHGIAHITGGGLFENFERILPDGVRAEIDRDSWDEPPVFGWLAGLGDVADDEMRRVFNMGIGLVMAVSPYYADSVQQQLEENGEKCWTIGRIVEGEKGVGWA
jgi:phosphoribosylformylglycinamidine cyclo-ligase